MTIAFRKNDRVVLLDQKKLSCTGVVHDVIPADINWDEDVFFVTSGYVSRTMSFPPRHLDLISRKQTKCRIVP